MKNINIGLIGYGTVGSGVAIFIKKRGDYIKQKFGVTLSIKAICDLDIHKKDISSLSKDIMLTTSYEDIIGADNIDTVVELIGGIHPAKEIAEKAIKSGKDFVTANKALISNFGNTLFKLADKYHRNIFFESSVCAGVPIIKTITEGIAGNSFDGIYGIVNGTCNFILSEMTKNKCSFEDAVKAAQRKGYAESDPTLDINGMDTAHKLAIMISLGFGKFVRVKDIYTEGITHISGEDIDYAESLGLVIKLLAISKKLSSSNIKSSDEIEARVHPTLISKDHPLASINGIYNAVFFQTSPLGNILISGEGAGQMAAASGVISDLINLASGHVNTSTLRNIYSEGKGLKIRKIDQIQTKFYIRFMVTDKPGVLSRISGILGRYGISINSVTQRAHNRLATVPVVMLTDYTSEKNIRMAISQINRLSVVRDKPVAIRMEKLQ